MGFEQTVSEYRQTKQDYTSRTLEEKEFIKAMALQKAWADRMSELTPGLDDVARESLVVNTMEELGAWFRKNVMEFPVEKNKSSRKEYYLELFEQDPDQAVRELYSLYRSELH